MRKHHLPRDTPKDVIEIIVPDGYDIEEILDTDDKGYGFEEMQYKDEEVRLKYGRDGKK